MIKVAYPGSFDPITNGHLDVIEQASLLFDRVVILIMKNDSKKEGRFSAEERKEMILKILDSDEYAHLKSKVQVEIEYNKEATAVATAQKYGCISLIRGIRSITDYEYELQMVFSNRHMSQNQINTIFLVPQVKNQYISSSTIKQMYDYKSDISNFVPKEVVKCLEEKNK